MIAGGSDSTSNAEVALPPKVVHALAPLAFGVSEALGVDVRPFLIAIAFGASASFATPVGYQTNTMVYAPGGYRFTDFTRMGVPLNLLFWVIAAALIPTFWPF